MARGNKLGHRRFGLIRQLPSGRFQASYLAPGGRRQPAPDTFERKKDAEQWLSLAESELLRGDWADPELGKVTVGEFGELWISEHKMGQRTREEYDSLFRHHIEPYIGGVEIGKLDTDHVRSWRTALLRDGRSEDRTAKAYRLLRAILNTATDDGRIKRNPCRVKGAGQHRTPERPTASVSQVYRLADIVPGRYRVLVLAAAMTGLRWGELIALRRCDLDLRGRVVHVYRRIAQTRRVGMVAGPTKSVAGARTVALPAVLVDELRKHLDTYALEGNEGLLFVGDRVGRCGGATSTVVRSGLRRRSRPGSRVGSISTICVTPATSSPPPPGRVHAS